MSQTVLLAPGRWGSAFINNLATCLGKTKALFFSGSSRQNNTEVGWVSVCTAHPARAPGLLLGLSQTWILVIIWIKGILSTRTAFSLPPYTHKCVEECVSPSSVHSNRILYGQSLPLLGKIRHLTTADHPVNKSQGQKDRIAFAKLPLQDSQPSSVQSHWTRPPVQPISCSMAFGTCEQAKKDGVWSYFLKASIEVWCFSIILLLSAPEQSK